MLSPLEEFAPLWGSEAHKYVLLRVDPGSRELSNCLIVEREHNAAMVIEDDELAAVVMQKMIDAGVQIVDELPETLRQAVVVK